tara:strand:+ start:4199 stop:5695 length:1497 start_codon:yes stop_codon:yes gene_type:complete
MHGIIFGGLLEDMGMDPDAFSIRRSSGAHKLATYLRQHNYDIEVVDYIHRWKLEELQEFTRKRISDKLLFFGFSCTFFIDTDVVHDFIKWLKQEYPNIPIVTGSQNAALESLKCDWYCYGYGEYALLSLLEHFQGAPEPVHENRVINAYANYKAFPKDELEVEYEDRDHIHEREILLLEFARGCKFKCSFCSFPVLGAKGNYIRNAQGVYDEMMRNYDKWGVTHYMVLDETFNDHSEKIKVYADACRKLPFKPKMTAYIRADLLVSKIQDWDNLIDMGITSHFYGVESMNHKSAKSIGKGMQSGKIQDGLLAVDEYFRKNAGFYKGHISLIAGLPHETLDTLRETVSWLSNYWSHHSYHMNVLMIKDLDNQPPSLNHNSEMDKDWTKFGYRRAEWQEDDIDWSKAINPYYKGLYDYVRDTKYYLNWENDDLSLHAVMRWCAEEFSQAKLRNIVDPFMYDKFFMDPSVEWKDFIEQENMQPRREHILNHIDGYISKKLL